MEKHWYQVAVEDEKVRRALAAPVIRHYQDGKVSLEDLTHALLRILASEGAR